MKIPKWREMDSRSRFALLASIALGLLLLAPYLGFDPLNAISDGRPKQGTSQAKPQDDTWLTDPAPPISKERRSSSSSSKIGKSGVSQLDEIEDLLR